MRIAFSTAIGHVVGRSAKPSVLIPNLLQRQFTVTRRNKAWVGPDVFSSGEAGSSMSLPQALHVGYDLTEG